MKKLLATIMALVMALTLVPAAWADGTDDGEPADTTESVYALTKDTDGSYLITSEKDLISFAKTANTYTANTTFKLTADIDLNGASWVPISWTVNNGSTFDGGNHTISNFTASGEKNVGLFSAAKGATIKNLNVDKAIVSGINQVGAIVGNGVCTHIENCKVTNSTITTKVPANGTDDGDKAGAIIGYLSAEQSASVKNCTAEDCTIKGYRDIGGLIGMANKDDTGAWTVTGNTAKNVVVIQDLTNDYKAKETGGKTPDTVGGIIGRRADGNSNTENNNSATYTVTINAMNGADVTTATVDYGGMLTPDTPTRDGYTFTGWFTNSACGENDKWTKTNTVTTPMTLYAGWTKDKTKSDTESTTTTEVSTDGKTKTETTTETAKNGTTTKTETVIDTTTGKISGTTVTETEKTTTAGTTTTTAVETKTTKNENNQDVTKVTKTVTTEAASAAKTETTTTVSEANNVATVTTEAKVETAPTTTKSTVTLDAQATEITSNAAEVKTVNVTIDGTSAKTLKTAAEADKVAAVEVVTDVGTLTINNTALKTITEKVANETDKLTLVVEKTSEGTTSTQTTTTTTTTYELTAKVNNVPVFKEVNKDKNGTITVTVPWETAPGFRQQIVCYYVDGNNRTRMGGTGYKDKTFSWDTNHFSKFEVVTETVSTNRAYINLNGSSSGTTTTTTTTTTGKANSATTFDAGVGVYAATAILSVTGMAWVGKKKH